MSAKSSPRGATLAPSRPAGGLVTQNTCPGCGKGSALMRIASARQHDHRGCTLTAWYQCALCGGQRMCSVSDFARE